MFISFEGTEGVGKTTLINSLADYLTAQAKDIVLTREPGGTPLAEQIRQLLLSQQPEPMSEDCELLLIFAARAQHIQQVILPALNQGKWVLSDRFVDASYAYQHGGRGLSIQKLDILAAQFVPVLPKLTFWLDAPVEVGMSRAKNRGALDRFEQEKLEFFERVRAVYIARAQAEPERIVRLDATQPPEIMLAQAIKVLSFLT
ncbi:dTMP kinase [Alkanindiges sp. WGS2144]|uniref:dTMP kinase n=1 Tax=Alkanindiges sp. WGS2144 TaxID=3366808 RepID=UPI00375369FA